MKNKYCLDCNKKITCQAKRCHSCAMKGINNSNYIDGRKLKQYYCIDCNKQLKSYNAKRCGSCANKFRLKNPAKGNWKGGITLKRPFCIDCNIRLKSYKAQRCLSCSKKHLFKNPKKNPMYGRKGKLHSLYIENLIRKYPIEFNEELKKRIRKRDNYQCQGKGCTMTEEEHLIMYGRVLEVHHINYDKMNCKKENLITTCKQCNIRANFNRTYWKKYYKEKLYELP